MSTLGKLCSLVLVLAAWPAAAATWYVDEAGSDANPGTPTQPWASLQHAADNVAAGDTIVLRAGSYAGAQFTTSGTANAPIVLRAASGETPVITSDNAFTPDGINLEGVSWMVIEGLTINNRGRAGIRAVGGAQWGLHCEHLTLRNNHLDHNGTWGIFTAFCADLLIEGNHASNSVDEHGIYVSNSGDRPVIRGNVIWGNHANGIHMNGDVSQGGDGIISAAVVECNIIFDNGSGGGSAINMDGVQNSLVRNNLIYDSHASGISLYQIDGGGPSSGNRVLNNTVLVAGDGRWALNIQDGAINTRVRNNILLNAHAWRGSIDISSDSLPGLDSDYNVLMNRMTHDGGSSILNLTQWQGATGGDSHSLVAAAPGLFVDAVGDDYRLAAASPAIDAGETLGNVVVDLTGTARPQGSGQDIGAFERPVDRIFANGFEP